MTSSAVDADDDDDTPGSQRLDKWLWFARIVKSRTLATKLVSEGKLRVNRVRVAKPSHPIKPGDVLTATVHRNVRVLKVTAIGARRGPASEAQTLYADLTPKPAASDNLPPVDSGDGTKAPEAVRPDMGQNHASPGSETGRPSKRDRRRISAFRGD